MEIADLQQMVQAAGSPPWHACGCGKCDHVMSIADDWPVARGNVDSHEEGIVTPLEIRIANANLLAVAVNVLALLVEEEQP